MRLTAPAIGGAAVVLAVALVSYFRPGTETPGPPDREAPAPQAAAVANEPSAVAAGAETAAVVAPPAAEARSVAVGASAAPAIERAPLPGETPVTPMTNLMVGRGGDAPPAPLVEGERAFAAEPIDRAWAPGAEADILSAFAQMPGLKLIDLQVECRSTMCRLQLMQPSGAQGGALPFKDLLDSVGLEARWMMTIKEAGNAPIKSAAYLWREGLAPPKQELGRLNESN
ncbi:MAG TPA: hypothetical protein VF405_11865 [Gammaproteobacteria bacterium]